VLTPDQALTVALWIMMAWAHPGAAIYSPIPILMVTSAEANSGKTTLLGLIGFLVPRSLPSVGVSEAALYRSIELWNPTIIADEFDTLLADNEPLRAVINSGWTRGSGVLRCVGDDKTPHRFTTFCPKVIGLKGRKLPDTTLSRAVIIELKRKKPSDRVEHFRHLDDAEFANVRRQALRWTMDNIATLETAVPKLPAGFDNRIGDNWRLMIAIADLAGGEWPDQARQATTVIAKVNASDMSIRVQLLADIRTIFATKSVDRIATSELIAALVDIDSHPWAEWKGGKAITASGLAKLLAPLYIVSGTIRVGLDKTTKGYQLGHFQTPSSATYESVSFSRDLPKVLFAATATQPLCRRHFLHFFEPPQWCFVAACHGCKNVEECLCRRHCGVVAFQHSGKGGEEVCFDPFGTRAVRIMIVPRPLSRGVPEIHRSSRNFFDAMISDARATPVCSVSQNFLALGEAFASTRQPCVALGGDRMPDGDTGADLHRQFLPVVVQRRAIPLTTHCQRPEAGARVDRPFGRLQRRRPERSSQRRGQRGRSATISPACRPIGYRSLRVQKPKREWRDHIEALANLKVQSGVKFRRRRDVETR
jgi:hypothetical protein